MSATALSTASEIRPPVELHSGEALQPHPDLRIEALPRDEWDRWQQKAAQDGLFINAPDGPTQINVLPAVIDLSPQAYAELESRANVLAGALTVAVDAIANNPQYFREHGILPSVSEGTGHPNEGQAQRFMLSDGDANEGIRIGRLDMFPIMKPDGRLSFQAIEFNGRCVEGIGYTTVIDLHAAAAFDIDREASAPTVAESIVQIARNAHAERQLRLGEEATDPQIGMVYWSSDRVKSVETPRVQKYAKDHGLADIAIGRPDALAAYPNENGGLDVYIQEEDTGELRKLDVIYRNIGLHDFTYEVDGEIASADLFADIVLNPNRYNVTVVPGTRQGLAGYKSLFAVISDPRFEHVFTNAGFDREQLELARDSIGWSRMLNHLETDNPDLAMVLQDHTNYVIKHIAGAGGADVVLGWSAGSLERARVALGCNFDPGLIATDPQTAWKLILDRAREHGGYMVQRKIEQLPLPGNAVMDIDPYIIEGQMGAVISRIGTDHPVNVKQGGGMAPVNTARRSQT